MTTRAELAELAQTPDGLRQIDAMAGKAFGFTPKVIWGAGHEDKNGWYISTRPWGAFKDKSEVKKWIAEHPVIDGKPVVLQSVEDWPDFTSSIADAWQLVEKINGKDSRNISISHSPCSDKWTVMFLAYRKRGTSTFVVNRDAHAEAATAPLAITIAALLAVEQKEKA